MLFGGLRHTTEIGNWEWVFFLVRTDSHLNDQSWDELNNILNWIEPWNWEKILSNSIWAQYFWIFRNGKLHFEFNAIIGLSFWSFAHSFFKRCLIYPLLTNVSYSILMFLHSFYANHSGDSFAQEALSVSLLMVHAMNWIIFEKITTNYSLLPLVLREVIDKVHSSPLVTGIIGHNETSEFTKTGNFVIQWNSILESLISV